MKILFLRLKHFAFMLLKVLLEEIKVIFILGLAVSYILLFFKCKYFLFFEYKIDLLYIPIFNILGGVIFVLFLCFLFYIATKIYNCIATFRYAISYVILYLITWFLYIPLEGKRVLYSCDSEKTEDGLVLLGTEIFLNFFALFFIGVMLIWLVICKFPAKINPNTIKGKLGKIIEFSLCVGVIWSAVLGSVVEILHYFILLYIILSLYAGARKGITQ